MGGNMMGGRQLGDGSGMLGGGQGGMLEHNQVRFCRRCPFFRVLLGF